MVRSSEGPQPTPKDTAAAKLARKHPARMLGIQHVSDDLRGNRNTNVPLSDASTALADKAEKDRAVQNLENNRFGIGQVNTEQPKAGGKIEPDERDGVRH